MLLCSLFHGAFAQTPTDSLRFSIADSLLDQTLSPIVVTAHSTPTALSASILPVRIITAAAIAERGAVSLTEVLQQEPNIRIERDPILGVSLTMNGLDGKHIAILLDGVPMIGRNGGSIDLDRIPVQHIVRIEIIENALSVAYGTNALGGTINIITQEAGTRPQHRHWTAQVMGQAQTNGQYDGSVLLTYEEGGLSLRLGYQYGHFQGWTTDSSRNLPWNPKQQHQPFARLYYRLPKTALRLGYHFNYLQEAIQDEGVVQIPRFPHLSYAKDYHYQTSTQDHAIHLQGYLDASKRHYLKGVVGYNQFRREKNAYFQPLADNPDAVRLDQLDSDTTYFGSWMGRWQLASSFHKRLDVSIGVDLRHDYTRGRRIESQYAALGDYALFGTIQYRPWTALTLHAGGRVAYQTRAVPWPFTYVLGLKWNPLEGLYVRASYTRGLRTPSLKELHLDFVDVNHFIKGNPQLRPEYAHNLRLSADYATAKGEHLFRSQLSLFYNYINDQIQLYSFGVDSLGQPYPDPSSLQYRYFNLDVYQNWGINGSLKYEIKGLQVELGASLTGHYNADHQRHPELLPPFQYTLEWSQALRYTVPKLRTRLALYRRDYDRLLRYSLAEAPLGSAPNVVAYHLAGYSLLDLTVSQSFLNDGLTLSLGVKNLLDVQQVAQSGSGGNHGGSAAAVDVAMGRVAWLRLVVQPDRLCQWKKATGLSGDH